MPQLSGYLPERLQEYLVCGKALILPFTVVIPGHDKKKVLIADNNSVGSVSFLLILFGAICFCSRRARHTLLTPVASSWTKDSYLKASSRGSPNGHRPILGTFGTDTGRDVMSQPASIQQLRSPDSTFVPSVAAAAGDYRGERGADVRIMSGLHQHPVTFDFASRDSWRASQTFAPGQEAEAQAHAQEFDPNPLAPPATAAAAPDLAPPPPPPPPRFSGYSASDSIYDSAQSHPPTPGLYATVLSPTPGRENRPPPVPVPVTVPQSPLPVRKTQVPFIVLSEPASGPQTPRLVHPDAAMQEASGIREASRGTVEDVTTSQQYQGQGQQSLSGSDRSYNRMSGEETSGEGTGLQQEQRSSQMSTLRLSHGTMSGQETLSSAFSWDEGASEAHTARDPGFGLSAFSTDDRTPRPRRPMGDPG